jgi:hypothetical protein
LRTTEDIVGCYRERKAGMGPLHARAREVTEAYNGELVIPMPELDRDEKRAVPNLLRQGVDQMAMRISSTVPDIYYPPERPGFKQSEQHARIRRQANLGWWEHSDMKLLLSRRARHLIAYASSPVVVRHDFAAGVPRWGMRHPLCTYPAPTLNPDDVHPDDCIFTLTRRYGWLAPRYPDAMAILNKGSNCKPDTLFELVEYMDDDELVLIVLGEQTNAAYAAGPTRPFAELERTRNYAGVSPAVVPGRVTLDRPGGAYDGMVGLYQRQAKLMALEVIAVQKGIFSNEWLVARANENPVIVREADGLRGITGIVRGGTIEHETDNPGYKTDQTIAQLERAQRLEAGIPAEFGGESTTNVRTGRRGDSILSAVVDFPIQEAHRILETALAWENKVAVACAKGYSDSVPRSFYVHSKGAKGVVQYTPATHFTTDSNVVSFSHAGADINSLIIGIGQMIGVGLISKELGRELNPMIEDPESEHDRVLIEALETALLSGLQQGAVSGSLPPADMARIMEVIAESDKTLVEAVQIVQREAQERQASAGAPGTPAAPAVPGSPEAQPGLAMAGAGAEAGTIGPTANEKGLASLMTALGHGARNIGEVA